MLLISERIICLLIKRRLNTIHTQKLNLKSINPQLREQLKLGSHSYFLGLVEKGSKSQVEISTSVLL